VSAVPLPRTRRWLTTVLCTAIVVPVLGSPQAARAEGNDPAPGDTVVGELVQAWVEHETHDEPDADPERADDDLLTWVETDDGDSVRLSTDDVTDMLGERTGDPQAELPVGATVEVVVGDEIEDGPTTEESQEPAREVLAAEVLEAAPEDTAPAGGAVNHEVTVVMMVPANGAVETGRILQQVLDAVNGPVRDYWEEQSGGTVRVGTAATNYDWAAPATADCSDYAALWQQAATRAGWTYAPGRHLLVYLPRNSAGCSYGLAEIGGSTASGGRLYVTDVATSVIAHELGHNFSLGHSATRQCDQALEAGSCRDVTYRDYYDVMGISGPWTGSLSGPHAARLGLLPADRELAVTAPTITGVHTLAPYGGPSGIRVVKLTDIGGVDYWLEYRTATGRDSWLGTPMNVYGLEQGVLLRRSDPVSGMTYLLDGSPSVASAWGNDWRMALPVGVPVGVSGAGFTVTVESADASGAAVRISSVAGDAYCGARSTIPTGGVALLTAGSSTSALVVGSDRGLWLRPIDSDASSWRPLGGGVLHGPAAANDGTTSYVFVVGLNGVLFYRANAGSGWSQWTALGGYLTGSPAAASLAEGQVRVFGRGLDGQLWSREFKDGRWTPWTAHGGVLTSPPTATADLDAGRIEVVVRGLDGLFYEQSLAMGAGPAPYVRRELMACSALALSAIRAAGDPAGGAFVDSRGGPRLLEATTSRPLGGVVTSTPAVEFPEGDVVVAGRGLDNALWLYDGRSATPGWRSLGGYIL
jgi:hypothetical protein